MLSDIGKFLRITRMSNGDTAAEMAKKLYISTSYLYLIENGQRKIPKDMENNILKAYKISDADKEILHSAVINNQKEKMSNDDLLIEDADDSDEAQNDELGYEIVLKKLKKGILS